MTHERANQEGFDQPAIHLTNAPLGASTAEPHNPSHAPAGASNPVRRRAASLAGEVLGDEVVGLSERLSSGTYELLVLVGEIDARGTYASWGALSCAAWLAEACDIDVATARTQVRVARNLRSHPELDAAMAAGDISYAKARVLVAHLDHQDAELTETERARRIRELVELAERTPAGALGAAIAAWSQRNDDPDQIAARQHAERATSWRTDPDGLITITTRLPPAAAGAVIAVIDAHVTTNTAPAGASLRQQRADALVTALATGGASVEAEVVVHVRGTNANTLADGTPIGDHAATALLPDAFISLLVHDMTGTPVDASPRRRHPTRRQRRVLDEAHPTCDHPGCTARTFLQYDHQHPFALGGPTTLANLHRLCGPHNREKERRSAGPSSLPGQADRNRGSVG